MTRPTLTHLYSISISSAQPTAIQTRKRNAKTRTQQFLEFVAPAASVKQRSIRPFHIIRGSRCCQFIDRVGRQRLSNAGHIPTELDSIAARLVSPHPQPFSPSVKQNAVAT